MVFPGSPYLAALGSGVGVLVVLLVQPGGLAVLAGGAWRRLATRLSGVDPSSAAARGGSAGEVDGIADALAAAGFAPGPDRLIDHLEVEPGAGPASSPDRRPSSAGEAEQGAAPPDPGSSAVLVVDGLAVRRGPDLVLHGVSLHVARGECLALVGTNGAGKSTLLSAIAGGLRPMAGAVRIEGIDATGADPGRVAQLGVAVHPGARACFPDLTVAEHLRLVERTLRLEAAIDPADLHPRLQARLEVPAGALSGGERHLLAFALAALQRPRLLLVDELSLGLAPEVRGELVAELARFRDRGCAIVVVDQRLEHLAEVADRAMFLERGEIRYEGDVPGLLASPHLLRPVLAASDRTRGRGAAPAPARPGPAALEVEHVSVAYGEVPVLAGVSLQVDSGTVLGVIGGNGAGKTTLLDAIAGEVDHDGQVRLGGRDLAGASPAARAALGLGRSLQSGSGVDALTVAECLALAQDRWVRPRSLTAAALRIPAARIADTDVRLRAELLAADAGLLEWLDTPSGDLSTGLRRRLELHMAATHLPSVLLLDEPTSGVASAEIGGLADLVRSLAERGAAVVVVDHDHDFIAAVADQAIELVDGRVVASGAPTSSPTSARSRP
jgi:branched-chain amino acid transport system ATP-binding protein